MITLRNGTRNGAQRLSGILTLGVLVCFLASGLRAHAQSLQRSKGPKPPSYEDVMQRALNQKKAASNAPVAPPVIRSAPVVATPAPAVPSPPSAVTPAPELKSASPPVVPATTPAVVAVENVPKSTPPATPAPIPAVVAPPVVKPTKGPQFSELPPDLRPRSEMEPSPASRTGGLLPSISPKDSTNAMAALDDKHRLAIGDVLSFRIIEDEEDPKPMLVTDSGELEVPHVGRYLAVGKTCKELAQALKAELEKEYYYQATVIIAVDQMTKSRGKVYLVGAVRMAGPQEIPSDEVLTVSKAILRAGGFTDFADKKSVKVTRKAGAGGPDQTFTVNVETILEKGKSEADLPLLPGDLIFVSERLIRF